MSINQAKDKIQREVLNAWHKNNYKGTAELATGTGKTRIGVLAASYLAKKANYNYKILIVTPTTVIQQEWENEFKLWKESKVFESCVQVECINTARNFKTTDFDLLIADEIHRYLGGQINLKLFKNNKFPKILGLSGTIEDNLLQELNKIAPIHYSLNLDSAVEIGLVSEFTVYNIPVELNINERKEYIKLSKIIEYSWQAYSIHSWKNISDRKNILYNAKSKIKLLEKLIKVFDNNSYGIIFSMTKDYANIVKNKLGDKCIVQHSGISKKNRIKSLKEFSDGRTKTRIISTAMVLDEGVNLRRIEYAILTANSSKGRQQLQRVGRVCRLGKDNKHAIIVRIYCKNTKEESWLETSQKGLKVVNLNNLQEFINIINNGK
jgi:superfamily II DNA or RNA helicase